MGVYSMGVYIGGLKMPKAGYVDVRIRANGICTTSDGEAPYYKEYAVTEVAPHGRLIDAVELINNMDIVSEWGDESGCSEEKINDAPTIIPPEK